ncbi:hypothetical protein GH5_01589 [Leishmania sp. Ghana 2012 LV757]|uniref:hypothetical protein n=1 Tax=Leishmania sp. Ghana 2012 LV757 TaxID=2803181 RepID=UPI001B66F65B|nr:hypothetical protein GH5_01589 [Leishmania sp. Ghana 2012 LV757]
MQYSSHSSSATSAHAAPLVCAPQMRFMMGPYSMGGDGAAYSDAVMHSEAELLTRPSTFPHGFYGDNDAAHPAQRETGLREAPGSETAYEQGASSAARLYECGESSGVGGFSRVIRYGCPSTSLDAVHNPSVAVAGFTGPHLGPAHRTISAATSGTALSECHLSRKDGGGFSSASARTFLKSDDSFGGRSENSRLSLHNSVVTLASDLSYPAQESGGSAYYLESTYQGNEQDHGGVTQSVEGAGVVSTAQPQLSNSTHVTSRGAVSPLRSENSFSMVRQADHVGRAASGPLAPHLPPHHQRSEFSTSQSGKFAPPRKRSTTESDLQRAATSIVSSASGSFGNGFGPTGCSPFYDFSTIATESQRTGRSPSAASSRDYTVSTTTAASRSGSTRLPSTRRRSASERRSNTRPSGSASASSTRSIATSGTARQRPLLQDMMSTASAESKETTSSHDSVNTSKPATGRASPSAPRKPRCKDTTKLNHSRSASIAAAHSVEGMRTSRPSSSCPVMPVAKTEARDSTPTAAPFAEASRVKCAMEDKGRCHTAVASQQLRPLRQQSSPASAAHGATPAFVVAPPSHDERHPRPFQRRRYLRGHVTPLSATEMQMTMVPFSPRRDVPPSRNTLRGPSPQTPAKTAVPLPPPQPDLFTLPGTTQAWSPSVTASSSASFSVTPDKLITVTSSPGARRTQQRLAGLAGFHIPLGVEGLCVASENSNERSLRNLGVRSGTELRMLGESSNGIMSRSCPSVEYSADEGTNPFLIQRSSSWSVHSARSTTDSSEVTGIARKKRQPERMPLTAHDVEEEHVTTHSKPSK